VAVIGGALERHRPNPKDAIDVLSKVGGLEIGGIAGVVLAGARYGIPVLIDGFISGAAALIAASLAPQVKPYLIAAHQSVEQGHKIILNHLGLKPLLNLDLRLGEGTGAALGMAVVEASLKILNEMATFSEAGVSEKI
jgi:nicotinate-nucleotide--dimethylbenzimidazole phosphoribosyltransferase